MTESRTPLDLPVVIEVTMIWSKGEREVGIYPAWEETFVTLEVGGLYRTDFCFEPSDDPVEDWRVEDIQVNLFTGWKLPRDDAPFLPRLPLPVLFHLGWDTDVTRKVPVHDEHGRQTDKRQMVLGDLPLLCEAVREHWDGLQREQEEQRDPGSYDPRPDPRTHPEFWTE